MFENLLFQDKFVETITHEIKTDALPQAMLFYGNDFTGKMTAAIEFSRVVNCKMDGEWNCPCHNCQMSRLMQNPYLVITGTRYFYMEIKQSAESLISDDCTPLRFTFIRNVRKLLKRFNQELWSEDDNKYKKVISPINNIEEYLEEIDPSIVNPKKLKKCVENIVKQCEKVISEVPSGNIPISQIRKINNWVRRSSSGHKRVIILENADYMQDSSRNSLLKILEEPPEDTYFILTSRKKSTVLPTILSRVRSYGFKDRSEGEQKLIVKNLFRSEGYSYLEDFFLSYSSLSGESIDRDVNSFYKSIMTGGGDPISDIISIKYDGDSFLHFLKSLSRLLSKNIHTYDSRALANISKLNTAIKEKIRQYREFNQSPSLLLETLYYYGKELFSA